MSTGRGPEVDRSGDWDTAVSFAEKLRACVYGAPLLDRATFPEDQPQFGGPLGMSVKTISDRLTGYDLAVAIGAEVFGYYPYVPGDSLPPDTEPLQITGNPAVAAAARVDDSLLGIASGGIGWGTPAAVGVALADRERGAHRRRWHPRSGQGNRTRTGGGTAQRVNTWGMAGDGNRELASGCDGPGSEPVGTVAAVPAPVTHGRLEQGLGGRSRRLRSRTANWVWAAARSIPPRHPVYPE
ncbi:hypothetical protein ACFVTC_29960 [Streptomyces sp. NPDC057950]|uniref:hypothetical protein n=1 Tax=Streptomyces sp. NPDC057950 TaxID=3346288 RepID=UPI0036E69CC0